MASYAQVLVGPRTDGKILGGEISTCLMESFQQDWNAAEKQEQLNNETYIDPLHQCFLEGYMIICIQALGFDVAFHVMKSMKVKFKLSEIACGNDCSCQERVLRPEDLPEQGTLEGKCQE